MNRIIECEEDFCIYATTDYCPYNSHRIRGYRCPMYESKQEVDYGRYTNEVPGSEANPDR